MLRLQWRIGFFVLLINLGSSCELGGMHEMAEAEEFSNISYSWNIGVLYKN